MRHFADHRWRLAGALDLLVDAHLAGGRPQDATRTVERMADTAAAGASPHLDALAVAARGRVAVARGDDEAPVHLEIALAAWCTLDLPLEAGQTRLVLARALAEEEPEVAVDHARRALHAFEDLGASADADRAAAFLRSLGVVPRTGPKGVGRLTQREEEVLALLGEGLSNPEIAQRLHVSRKTAAHHVSSILAKLGLRNRAEAAAHAATHHS